MLLGEHPHNLTIFVPDNKPDHQIFRYLLLLHHQEEINEAELIFSSSEY